MDLYVMGHLGLYFKEIHTHQAYTHTRAHTPQGYLLPPILFFFYVDDLM